MIILTIVRHGESTDNLRTVWAGWSDAPLSQHGMNQAKALGESLSNYKVDHIFASPLLRATWTAQQIQRHQPAPQPPITFSPLLREQHFGKAERQPFAATKSGPGFFRESGRTFKFEAGESLDDVRSRADAAVAQYIEPILLAARGKPVSLAPHVFIVAHGIFNSELLGSLLTRRPANSPRLDWKYWGMTNTGWTRIELAYEDEGLIGLDEQPRSFSSVPEEGTDAIVEEANGISAASVMSGGAGPEPIRIKRDGPTPPDQSSVPGSPPRLMRILSGSSSRLRSPSNSRSKTVAPSSGPPRTLALKILGTNVTTHLEGLKRQQGGIGSSAHDDKQKDIRSYFGGS